VTAIYIQPILCKKYSLIHESEQRHVSQIYKTKHYVQIESLISGFTLGGLELFENSIKNIKQIYHVIMVISHSDFLTSSFRYSAHNKGNRIRSNLIGMLKLTENIIDR